MRQIAPHSLWLGHIEDARDLRAVHSAGIRALVDLAANELPVPVSRDLIYCRFPLVDGLGNSPDMLRLAISVTADLLRCKTPTLVFCSAGMSRTPAVAAAALSRATGRTAEQCLAEIVQGAAVDLSPAFWRDVVAVLAAMSPCRLPASP